MCLQTVSVGCFIKRNRQLKRGFYSEPIFAWRKLLESPYYKLQIYANQLLYIISLFICMNHVYIRDTRCNFIEYFLKVSLLFLSVLTLRLYTNILLKTPQTYNFISYLQKHFCPLSRVFLYIYTHSLDMSSSP